jgi:hypothetical protein
VMEMKKRKIYLVTIDNEGVTYTYSSVRNIHSFLFRDKVYSYFALASVLRRNKSFDRFGIKIQTKELL